MSEMRIMQVKNKMYAYKESKKHTHQWVMLEPHIGSDGWQYREVQKASPLTAARYDYALVNFDDRLVFVTGGIKMSIWLSSVEYYSIEGDFWMQAPPLHVARRMHSGCALGEHVYVFAGEDE